MTIDYDDKLRLARAWCGALTTEALIERLTLLTKEPSKWTKFHKQALLEEATKRLTQYEQFTAKVRPVMVAAKDLRESGTKHNSSYGRAVIDRVLEAALED